MNQVVITMTKAAYNNYMKSTKDGGGGFKDPTQLVKYLNEAGGYMGEVIGISVDKEDNYYEKEYDKDVF